MHQCQFEVYLNTTPEIRQRCVRKVFYFEIADIFRIGLGIYLTGGNMVQGQVVGYIRVSSAGQNMERQLEGLRLDRVFEEKISGKNQGNRVALQEMLKFVREGDEVLCHSMDRLARNLGDLLQIVTGLTEKGVKVTFTKQNMTFTGDDSAISNLMLSVIGAVAAFELQILKDRQAEGIAIAKAKGVYKGRKPSLTPGQAAQLRERAQAGEPKAALAREFKISRETLYQYLRAGALTA